VSSLQLSYPQVRRSSRVNHAIPLKVKGWDNFHAPYLEQVSTLTVSCHGCRYRAKNDVLLGDVVLLEPEGSDHRLSQPSRARVKQVQKLLTDDRPFEVIVELESPGNIWGIASPPRDWFPVQDATTSGPASSAQGLQVVARAEQQIATTTGTAAINSHPQKDELAASLSPFLAQLMVGLGEQIQVMASKAATAAIANEKDRLLDEFRVQLQDQATKTLKRVIVASKEEMAGPVLRELNKVHETHAAATYERWNKKLEQDFGNAAERAVGLSNKVTERIEGATAGAIEQVQSSTDACRRDAMDQFRAQLRSQLSPLLEEAQTTLQKLLAFEDELRVRSLALCGQFNDFLQQEAHKVSVEMQERISSYEKQFESGVSERLANGYEKLDKKSSAAVDASAEALLKLSDCERAAQNRLASMVELTVSQATSTLKQQTAELANQFSTQLEGYRSYLALISGSIAELAKGPVVARSHDEPHA
jgi:hypothetical protein